MPVRTTAGGSYSELVEQPRRIVRVPVRITAFKTEAARGTLFSLRISNTPTADLTFKALIIPQTREQSLDAKPKLGTCASVRAKKLTSTLRRPRAFHFSAAD